MKEKIIVYPFDTQFEPVYRHVNLLLDYDITGLVSPKGWGLTGELICSDFEEQVDLCNTVIFSESIFELDFKKFIYPKIVTSIHKSKNIILLMHIENELEEEITVKCKEHDVYFKYYGHNQRFSQLENYQAVNAVLFEINTPVIFILGISERTNKLEIQLSLREYFLNSGYKVSQIGSRHYCELFGFYSFPDFMFSSNIDETSKVILFNRYVKEIENKEHPDVILIGIPGGIMPFNNEFTNRFGILAFEVSQAIIPDAAVMSILYEDYNPEYFETLSRSVRYKLGFDIDCFNLANRQFDWNSSKNEKRMVYTTLNTNFIDKKKINYKLKTPVYNILNKDDSQKMASYLISSLSSYGIERIG